MGVQLAEHWQEVEISGWVCTLLPLLLLLASALLLLLVLLLAAESAAFAFVVEEVQALKLEVPWVLDLPFDLSSQQNPCPWVDRLGLVDLVVAVVAALGLELVGRVMAKDLEQWQRG